MKRIYNLSLLFFLLLSLGCTEDKSECLVDEKKLADNTTIEESQEPHILPLSDTLSESPESIDNKVNPDKPNPKRNIVGNIGKGETLMELGDKAICEGCSYFFYQGEGKYLIKPRDGIEQITITNKEGSKTYTIK